MTRISQAHQHAEDRDRIAFVHKHDKQKWQKWWSKAQAPYQLIEMMKLE